MIASACVAVGALVGTLLLPEHYADAATTAVSTIYKTATNTRTGSVAASSDAPGGAKIGTAQPGDKLKWVVSYQNNTTTNASMNLKDVISNAGTYVPGSLELPPNQNAVGTFNPIYSTNGGTTWVAGTPPANANGLGFSGNAVPQGTKQLSVAIPSPVPLTLQNSGGDGYNAVVSADGLRAYAVFHHTPNGSGSRPVCARGGRPARHLFPRCRGLRSAKGRTWTRPLHGTTGPGSRTASSSGFRPARRQVLRWGLPAWTWGH
jgi:hypothetical protein